jgi:hypothetical protein
VLCKNTELQIWTPDCAVVDESGWAVIILYLDQVQKNVFFFKMPTPKSRQSKKENQILSGNISTLLIHGKQRKAGPKMLYACFVERTSVVALQREQQRIFLGALWANKKQDYKHV